MRNSIPPVELLASNKLPGLRTLRLEMFVTSEGEQIVVPTGSRKSAKIETSTTSTKTVRPGRKAR